MNDNRREQIYENMATKETEELLEIWQDGDTSEWEQEVFEIIQQILLERLGHVPPQSIETQVSHILVKVENYQESNELEKALSECKLTVQLDPEDAVVYTYQADIYLAMGQLHNAIASYQKAIQLDPDLQDAWDGMLSVEAELEDEFEESIAKQHLDQALDYAYDNEFDKALAECEAAKPYMPGIAIAYNYLGLILQTMNRYESAIDAYLKAIELNPRFFTARENLASSRVSWEEEQYHLYSNLPVDETQDNLPEIDESQISESAEPVPQWLYMDEKSFLLTGWAGHRTRQGRTGYDQLESEFEFARMQGMMLRLLFTRKFRTRNPLHLAFMLFVGGLFFIPGISLFISGDIDGIFSGIVYSPYTIAGALLLVNVYQSLRLEPAEEDNGQTFF